MAVGFVVSMRKNCLKISMGLVVILVSLFLFSGNSQAVGTYDCPSGRKCPNFQVWGGSIFTYGDIVTSNATPRVVDGNQFMFSSWVEYGVFANGRVNGLASGAASSGGSLESGNPEFCKYRTPLSFANYSVDGSDGLCGRSNTNGITGLFGYNYPRFNMRASIEALKNSGTPIGNGGNENADISISADTITERRIVATYGNVTITGDLVYNTDDKVYYSLEEVPKLLIYAKDINIECGVGRVDAILFASGNVNTCSNGAKLGNGSPNYEDQSYSKQLTINGAIIAGNVNFQRTYGAVDLGNTTDRTSGDVVSKCSGNVRFCASIPAEIVNYDVSILVTGKSANTASAKTNLVTVYQRELSPRY